MPTTDQLDKRLKTLEGRIEALLELFGVRESEDVAEAAGGEPEFEYEFGFAADADVYRVAVSGPVNTKSKVVVTKGDTTHELTKMKDTFKQGSFLEAEISLDELSQGTWDVSLVHRNKSRPITTLDVVDATLDEALLDED